MTIERRKYFRIQDTALVKYRIVQSDMLDYERRQVHLNQIKIENTRAALFGIETQLHEIVDRLRHSAPDIVEAVELINRKINLIERVVSYENSPVDTDDYQEHEPVEINLSGGGMAMEATGPLAINAHLAIDLVLLPDNDPMRIFGRVVDCRDNNDGYHTISIAFDEIRDVDRDRLIQHVLRKQSEEIRAVKKSAVG